MRDPNIQVFFYFISMPYPPANAGDKNLIHLSFHNCNIFRIKLQYFIDKTICLFYNCVRDEISLLKWQKPQITKGSYHDEYFKNRLRYSI